MAIVSKYASVHSSITGGYTNPANAYANDGNYATAAPAKNAEISAYFGFAGFTTGEIPEGAIIESVKVSLEYYLSATNSVPTQGIQVFRQTTGIDAEQTNTSSPAADTLHEHTIGQGVSLGDLRSADFVRARVRSHRGNTNTAVTFYIKYVQITVEWSDPPVGHSKALSDQVSASDVSERLRIITKGIADGVGVSDGRNAQAAYVRVQTDAASVGDSNSTGQSTQRIFSESVSVNDANTSLRLLAKTISDSVTVSQILSVFNSNSMSGKIASLATRIGQEVKAIWNAVAGKADVSHTHAGTYEPIIMKTAGYLTHTGSAWVWKNETYSLSSHNHAGVYEPAFTKNTAFNKDFGTGAGTVTQGNDSRLSDTRTPSDATVTYGKLGNDLVSRNTLATSMIDWNAGGVTRNFS